MLLGKVKEKGSNDINVLVVKEISKVNDAKQNYEKRFGMNMFMVNRQQVN